MFESSTNQYLADLKARYRASPLPGFLAWWGSELAELVPETIRRRLMPPKPEVWIVPAPSGGGDLKIMRPGPRDQDPPEVIDVFGAGEDLELLRGRWLEVLHEFDDGAPEIRLCLGEEYLLEVPVTLPAAVEGDLGQALGYQLDQLTPFRADQALFGYRVVRRDTDKGRLDVQLKVIPNTAFEPVQARLNDLGIVAHAVDAIDSGAEQPVAEGFNLLPEDRRPTYVHARARLNWMLAGALVLAVGLVMVQSLYLRANTVEELELAASELRDEARAVMDLQQQLEDSMVAANFLAERRRQQPVNVAVLAELTEILPDDIWLNQFRLQGGELFVQGLADGSQRLISLLNESGLIRDAEFRGSIATDRASGQERFQATAEVATPAASDQTDGADDADSPES